MLRPRLPSAILEPVILVESLFPHTNLRTLLCALCTWSAVMPAYLMCHVSTAICGLCQLVCVLNWHSQALDHGIFSILASEGSLKIF